ncbi:MAG TPA: glucoamylase family protein, partial [Longimicrobiales bacterium]|nr:glucoamylase family protein [Longimicrobiales bacterium]
MRPRRAFLCLWSVVLLGCGSPSAIQQPIAPSHAAFLDTLQERTFRFFWERANSANGLVPDRWPTRSFSSVAAVGFGLASYAVGAEHGWITRGQAADRTLTTVRFLWRAPQGPQPVGATGHQGLFYHFLDMQTGLRFEQVELSTIDTALLMAGVLFAQQYFDGSTPVESEIRSLADSLYLRVNWQWMVQPGSKRLTMGWHPERGYTPSEWHGYDEAAILMVLALGSPTHPVDTAIWTTYTSTYRWGTFHGQQHVGFAPLFGHQYSHV